MTDKKKVIKGLEICTNISPDGCLRCPYKDEKDETYSGFCEQVLKHDALSMLKEQETAKAALKVLSDRQCEVSPHYYERKGFCPKCHQEVKLILNRNYCGFCGQALKWKEGEI